ALRAGWLLLWSTKIVVAVQIALDFLGKGSIAVDRRRPRWVARPAWSKCRACGGASIANGAMPTQRENGNGQAANQQAGSRLERRGRRAVAARLTGRLAQASVKPGGAFRGDAGGSRKCDRALQLSRQRFRKRTAAPCRPATMRLCDPPRNPGPNPSG